MNKKQKRLLVDLFRCQWTPNSPRTFFRCLENSSLIVLLVSRANHEFSWRSTVLPPESPPDPPDFLISTASIQQRFHGKQLLRFRPPPNIPQNIRHILNMAEHGAYSPSSRTQSAFHQRSSHSRSASWSYTSGNGQITLTPLNPIRSVIREFVPSFGHRSPTSRSSASSPLSPLSPSTYVNIAEVLRDENDVEDSESNRVAGFAAVNSNSGNSSDGDAENGDANMAAGNSNNGNGNGRSAADRVEFQGTISWLEKSLPFVLLLLSRIMWDHRLGRFLSGICCTCRVTLHWLESVALPAGRS